MISDSNKKSQSHMPCAVIVVAAGRGRRFGGEIPKQYLPLMEKPLLWHTLNRLQAHPLVSQITPVIAPDGLSLWEEELGHYLSQLPKVLQPVLGGAERQQSVWNALESLTLSEEGWVAIHDGVRPLISSRVLNPLLAARDHMEACLSAIPAMDTVKRTDAHGVILETLDRNRIWLAHTPQLFRYGLILRAHRQAAQDGFMGTDDTSLVERLAQPVGVVPGDCRNIKVTRPEDLALVEQYLIEEARDGDSSRARF